MLVTVATEDVLSASVATRLMARYAPQSEVTQVLVLDGINNIKARMQDLVQIAGREDLVLVLADLDHPNGCPLYRVSELSGGFTRPRNLLIRIAMPEIESWIMADRNGIAQWLNIPANIVPRYPESLNDPKRTLVQLASRSRNRAWRQRIAPSHVLGTHRTGAGYNILLREFVTQHWNPDVARGHAPSLARAIARIDQLAAP